NATTTGDAITVTAPSTTSNINFALAPGAMLSGTVTNANGGAGINNIFVAIFNSGGNFLSGASTDQNGYYFTILPSGTYYAAVINAAGFANQLYNGLPCSGFCNVTAGTQIHVTVPTAVTGINFSLTSGGSITGHVLDGSNSNNPINLMSVQLYSSAGAFFAQTNTDSMGNYIFSG